MIRMHSPIIGGVTDIDPELQQLIDTLFQLARSGDAALLQQYLAAGVDPNLQNHEGNTLIMLAAYSGNLPAVEALIAAGADVDMRNGRNQTPIAGAIFKKEDAIMDALLAAGADVTAGQPSALDTARMFGRDDLVAKMQPAGDA